MGQSSKAMILQQGEPVIKAKVHWTDFVVDPWKFWLSSGLRDSVAPQGEPAAQPVCNACYNYAAQLLLKRSGNKRKLWKEHVRQRSRQCEGWEDRLRERAMRRVGTLATQEGGRVFDRLVSAQMGTAPLGKLEIMHHPATMGWIDDKTDKEHLQEPEV